MNRLRARFCAIPSSWGAWVPTEPSTPQGEAHPDAPPRPGRIPCTIEWFRSARRALKNIETWLDKAEQYAAAKKFDVGVLMTSRLAPDMQPFIYQVQSACDYAKGAAAWLSGQKPPKHEDTEQTIDEVRARIRKTVAFTESVTEAQYAGASERKVGLSWMPGKVIGGEDYLTADYRPERVFSCLNGVRYSSPQRCRCRQNGFSRSNEFRRPLISSSAIH